MTAVTVRLSTDAKRLLQARARRERRSLSAQMAHELEALVVAETRPLASGRRRFMGLFAGARVPVEREFREARALLWGSLARRESRR